jgi:hypothetical protein
MSRDAARARSSSCRTSLYDEITTKIIAELEAGRVPWVQPWGTAEAQAPLAMPKNAATSRFYSGINVLILWGSVIEHGFPVQSWLTFRQAVRRASRMKGATYGSMRSVHLCRHFPHAASATTRCEAGMKAQDNLQSTELSGKAKVGQANANESLSKRAVMKVEAETLADTAELGNANWGELGPTVDTAPRRKKDAHPDCNSFMWNTETPMGTADMSAVGRPQGKLNAQREQESPRSERRQIERSGKRITRRIGKYPNRKVADVGLVNRPNFL